MRLNITPELFASVFGHTLRGSDSRRVDSFLVLPLLDYREAESLLVQLTVVVMNSLRAVLLAGVDFPVNSHRKNCKCCGSTDLKGNQSGGFGLYSVE